jgi:hypothetical protein
MTARNGATDPHPHENMGSDRKGAFVSTVDVRFGIRLCENVHRQRMRRIVFSIGFSRQWSPALLVFKSTKSRWNFYKKILRGSFHTAWNDSGNSFPRSERRFYSRVRGSRIADLVTDRRTTGTDIVGGSAERD